MKWKLGEEEERRVIRRWKYRRLGRGRMTRRGDWRRWAHRFARCARARRKGAGDAR